MESVEERVTAINERVNKMDRELKAHFVEFRMFVVDAVGSAEKRLGARFDKRLDGIDKRMERFETKLDVLIDLVSRQFRTAPRKLR